MSASPILIFWCLAAPLLLGFAILRALGLRYLDAPVSGLGWAWVCGCVYLGIGLFSYEAVGLGPASWWTVPLLLGCPLAWLASVRRQSDSVRPSDTQGSKAYLFFALSLASLCLVGVVASGSIPIMETDEATIWAKKAKLLFHSNGYDQVYRSGVTALPHADYPLLNPLLQAWMFSQAGQVLHFLGRLPIVCFSIALLLISAGGLRRLVGSVPASACLLVIMGGEVFEVYSQRGHADLMLACGCLMAFDGWLRWNSQKCGAYAAIACIGMTLALWSKNEAVLYLAAAIGAVAVHSLLSRSLGTWTRTPWLLLPIAVGLAQFLLNSAHGLSNDLLGDNPEGESMLALVVEQFADRLLPLLTHARNYCANYPLSSRSVYLLLIPALLLVPGRILGGDLRIPTLTIMFSLLGIFLVYVGSYWELDRHLVTSADRVMYQMVPFTVLWLALVANRLRTSAA